jgi:hypothetical protein
MTKSNGRLAIGGIFSVVCYRKCGDLIVFDRQHKI